MFYKVLLMKEGCWEYNCEQNNLPGDYVFAVVYPESWSLRPFPPLWPLSLSQKEGPTPSDLLLFLLQWVLKSPVGRIQVFPR